MPKKRKTHLLPMTKPKPKPKPRDKSSRMTSTKAYLPNNALLAALCHV